MTYEYKTTQFDCLDCNASKSWQVPDPKVPEGPGWELINVAHVVDTSITEQGRCKTACGDCEFCRTKYHETSLFTIWTWRREKKDTGSP
jgi:hypothetical protein